MRELKSTIAAVFGEVWARAAQHRAADAHRVPVCEGDSACSPKIEAASARDQNRSRPQVRSRVMSYNATCKIVTAAEIVHG